MATTTKTVPSRLDQHLQQQLTLESERIYTLLLQADRNEHTNQLLTQKLSRSKEKLLRANDTITRLTSDVAHLQEKTTQLHHKLELSHVSIQRNDEQHALVVKALHTNWDVERKKYQQQIEELQHKVGSQNDKDRRLWARRSFSLPPRWFQCVC